MYKFQPKSSPVLIEDPEKHVDIGRPKQYTKSRYMTISTSKEFRKELVVADIADNEIIYANLEQNLECQINAKTLTNRSEEPCKISDPASCCFVPEFREGKPISTKAKFFGILCGEGIRLVKRGKNNLFREINKYKLNTENSVQYSSLSVNGPRKVGDYVGLFVIR